MKELKVLAMVIMLAAGMQAAAQNDTTRTGKAGKPSKEEIMKKRWHALAGRMMLTDKQTEELEGTYYDYMKELAQLRADKRSDRKESRADMDGKKNGRLQMSDEQVAKMTVNGFDIQRKRIDIKEKYFEKFSKVLSARQANYLLKHGGMKQGQKKRMKKQDGKRTMPRKRLATGV